MDRRNFLLGTLGGVVSAGLIVEASDADILKFTSKTKIGEPLEMVAPEQDPLGLGHFVYNRNGNPIGVIAEVHATSKLMDMTSAQDTALQYVRGYNAVVMTVLCTGMIKLPVKSL